MQQLRNLETRHIEEQQALEEKVRVRASIWGGEGRSPPPHPSWPRTPSSLALQLPPFNIVFLPPPLSRSWTASCSGR